MKIKSNLVIIAIFTLITLLVVQIALYANFFLSLEKQTATIAELSRLRGDIQRYTKFGLAMEVRSDLGENIARLIDYYVARESQVDTSEFKQYYNISELKTQWEVLAVLVERYNKKPSEELRVQIISQSEHCWKVADSFVLRSEFFSDKTIASLKYFTGTMALNLLIFTGLLILYKKYVHNTLQSSSTRDYLTGVFNRRYFYEFLNHEVLRATRKNHTFSVILFDIDFFKKVNDAFGHSYGDVVLKTLTQVVQGLIRKSDVLARIGGEEFIILLPDTNLEKAYLLSEKIRRTVASHVFPEDRHITISLGVAEHKEGELPETIISRTDGGLYSAKNNGRNRSEKA